MGIFNIFIKKDNKFLVLLNHMAEKLTEASTELEHMMNTADDEAERKKFNLKIKEIEAAGDKINDAIFLELNTTFITPFDREDIQALASKMDDVLDFIHGVAKRIIMYGVHEIPSNFTEFASIINQQCHTLQTCTALLGKVTKNPDEVIGSCRKIHELESKADVLYAEFVSHLFQECHDPVELIKQNEIVQFLEDTTDRSDDVADVIRTIIVKYN